MTKLNLLLIKQKLFENEQTRARILKDFGVKASPFDVHSFASLVIQALKQPSIDDPLPQELDNNQVFEAAVKAIGSNMRNWNTFVACEKDLRLLLGGYDPASAHRFFQDQSSFSNMVKKCLPGQTSSHDVKAIRDWAYLLLEVPNYYRSIREVGIRFRHRYEFTQNVPLGDGDLAICLVGHFTDNTCSNRLKFPGMGYALASEFMKNLRWNAFKPDRHVRRLFDRWLDSSSFASFGAKVSQLQRLILGDKRRSELRKYLTYSLAGMAVCPAESRFSEVDNLVWLLGKYIETKGRETMTSYILI